MTLALRIKENKIYSPPSEREKYYSEKLKTILRFALERVYFIFIKKFIIYLLGCIEANNSRISFKRIRYYEL
jgi:hypothetical protein